MTLNIVFFTITIKKREATREEVFHEEMVKELFEETREKQVRMMNQI
ncbi:YrzI family small protein [Mesobacillus zeae]|uniref:YrzI family small protein n=1 Tax=Mesobacillus zeae TaxID=1917180 RepID=A0A398B7T2_9BACI|nr:YrzI family small protein [Mesobacillus zeae]RID83766.1 YrzI family small protein [Mesobacillus zeae]